MALYRETATGFVQEYASNPGAGYTLISTMPTTSINARAEWWRDLDKWNQTSAWHPSLGSTAQDPNDNFLQIVFTNDSALVSSDANGNVTDGFLGATTQVRMMRGSQNVTLTEGWSFGLAKSPDVPAFTYTWTGTDVRTLQITGFPTDTTSGYIRITATRTGSTTQVKDFKILKVIRGTDGTNGTNGSNGVRGSRQIVVDGTSWSDAAAWNGIVAQTGTTPVLSDLVTIANAGAAFSASKFYTGGAYDGDWVTPNAYINGNLLVTGTVGADKIVSGSITTTQLNFNPVTTGNVVASINATAEGLFISGSRINIDGTVTFGAGYNPLGKIASGGAAADVNANATEISGGKITTNSIAASKIVTNSITTSQLNFTPVTAGGAAADINAYTTQITGERIQTGSIVADKIDTRNLTIKDASGTTIFSAGVPLSSTYIASLTADKISSGTIAATYIYMNNVNGGIQSTTFSPASNGVPGSGAGFLIRGDGYVQLNNCDIRGNLQSSSFVSGSTGWRVDYAGNAEFNTVMVRTKNIENNSVTKMTGGSVATRSTQNLSNWDDQITINCDGGDILASVSVTLNGTTEFTYGNFTLYINGSQVDYKTCTAVTNGSSSVTVSGYYVNAPSGNVIVRLYSFVDNNSNNGGTWSGSYYAINGKK